MTEPQDQNVGLLDRPITRFLIVGVLLASLGLGAFALQRARGSSDGSGTISVAGAPTPQSTSAPETGIGPLDDHPPLVGQPAPNFALKDATGRVVTLVDLRGKVVWVNFWATWCVPCKKELPDIQKLYDEKHGAGLEVLALNWQDSPASATDFFASLNLTLPLLLDRRGDVYQQYRLQGLPDSFFIDRDGNVAAMYFGSLSEKRMREKLAAAGLP